MSVARKLFFGGGERRLQKIILRCQETGHNVN